MQTSVWNQVKCSTNHQLHENSYHLECPVLQASSTAHPWDFLDQNQETSGSAETPSP